MSIEMALITQAAALLILPLAFMKLELRIDSSISEHDDLISKQIQSAVNFVSRSTGAVGDDLLPLRAAAVSLCRELYDGYREIGPRSTAYGLMEPFKSWEAG